MNDVSGWSCNAAELATLESRTSTSAGTYPAAQLLAPSVSPTLPSSGGGAGFERVPSIPIRAQSKR
jgi:hypothetical protein